MLKHSHESLTPWATPYDVHCVERERFPQPVAGRSLWRDRLTFALLFLLAGVCLGLAGAGLVLQLAKP